MTEQDLRAIRDRCEAATPGPWRHSREDMISFNAYDGREESFVYMPEPNERICIRSDPPVEDAEFIAHAREDIPALLAEIERMRCVQVIEEADDVREDDRP